MERKLPADFLKDRERWSGDFSRIMDFCRCFVDFRGRRAPPSLPLSKSSPSESDDVLSSLIVEDCDERSEE